MGRVGYVVIQEMLGFGGLNHWLVLCYKLLVEGFLL